MLVFGDTVFSFCSPASWPFCGILATILLCFFRISFILSYNPWSSCPSLHSHPFGKTTRKSSSTHGIKGTYRGAQLFFKALSKEGLATIPRLMMLSPSGLQVVSSSKDSRVESGLRHSQKRTQKNDSKSSMKLCLKLLAPERILIDMKRKVPVRTASPEGLERFVSAA